MYIYCCALHLYALGYRMRLFPFEKGVSFFDTQYYETPRKRDFAAYLLLFFSAQFFRASIPYYKRFNET